MSATPFLDGYRSTVDPAHLRDSPPEELTATAHEIVAALRRDCGPASAIARGISAGIVAKLFGIDLSGGRA